MQQDKLDDKSPNILDVSRPGVQHGLEHLSEVRQILIRKELSEKQPSISPEASRLLGAWDECQKLLQEAKLMVRTCITLNGKHPWKQKSCLLRQEPFLILN